MVPPVILVSNRILHIIFLFLEVFDWEIVAIMVNRTYYWRNLGGLFVAFVAVTLYFVSLSLLVEARAGYRRKCWCTCWPTPFTCL